MTKLLLILSYIAIVSGCKKEEIINVDESFVSVINASPKTNLAIFVDTMLQVRVPFRSSIRNISFNTGSHIISFTDSAVRKTFLAMPAQEFIKDETSTNVVYDTLHPVDSTVRAIRLSDDLSLPPAGFVKVRFIHAAPLTLPVDVTFLRTSVTPVDSITFAQQIFIGNAQSASSISAFSNIPIGAYTMKVKATGTQDTIMNTLKLSISNLAGVAGISGITTFYLTGNAQGEPLRVNLFRHYP